ncbi:hypothetical protein DQ04_10601020 [Trypanosoma grayi]|uniref:hypothetical protein n=1 Tax=Trypanosoma grayi TaxID=71804 RepID=UPI0004F469BE|nr:hypothetical protein DQ04_10601020 [Trypanosoma grayi]KEG07194.1 hypothetical protein DQ04_10601020 [Trypanosoma grayi]
MAHKVNRTRHGKCTPTMRHGGAFLTKRGVGACRRRSDRTQSPPSTAGSAGETSRPPIVITQQGSLRGALGPPGKQVGTSDDICLGGVGNWAMPPWACLDSWQDKGQLFQGHSILRRTHRTRVTDKNDERRLP